MNVMRLCQVTDVGAFHDHLEHENFLGLIQIGVNPAWQSGF